MTATTVTPELTNKRASKIKVWRCQYCVTGHHGSCPGAVRHSRRIEVSKGVFKTEPVLWLCQCSEGSHPGLHCLECKNDNPDDVDPQSWRCLDQYVCAGLLLKRQQHSQVWQMLQAAKSRSAIIRRAKRLNILDALAQVDPAEDLRIDYLTAQMDALAAARQAKTRKARGVPRPRSGQCECCGEPTKGGRFLSGHDAKLASALKKRVEAGDEEAYEDMKNRKWLKKLPTKLLRPEDRG